MKSTQPHFTHRLVLWVIGFGALLVIALSPACNRATLDNGQQKGQAALGCLAGTVDCGGVCVSQETDAANCGACGKACGVDELCNGGTCSTYCVPGDLDCGGVCLVAQSDLSNCGVCGVGCTDGEFCDKGKCSEECTGTLCPTAGGTACVHPQSNNDHCGACGAACGRGEACSSGVCVPACPSGRALCTGACVDARSDASNCGRCGETCPSGVACVEGVCGGGTAPGCVGNECLCTEGRTECNGVCVDTAASPFHCGECAKECGAGKECTTGRCECLAGTVVCGDTCVDTSSDNRNCGECGKSCTGGTSCELGTCECDSGLDICDDTCVDLQESLQHCGECGNDCAAYETCASGICTYDGDQCGGKARGIRVERVAVYQSVEQDLFNGSPVATSARKVDVIQGREAMVRVFVEPEAGFASRELSARLVVDNDGAVSVYHDKRIVSGASIQSDLDTTFTIDVPPEAFQEETQYWVELVECGELPAMSVGSLVRFPSVDGTRANMDARNTGTIRVVFVPIVHDGRTPDTAPATIEVYAQEVENLYPIVDVESSVRAPVDSSQSGIAIDFGVTLSDLSALRTADGVERNVYYYGLIDPAASYQDFCGSRRCVTGLGFVADPGEFHDRYRAAVGIGFETRGAETFAHELGHNHGRWHAPCGNPDDLDPDFPYTGALTGEWGYDRSDQSLKDPSSATDFMAYCGNVWISDYSYRAIAERIATMNGVVGASPDLSGPQQITTWESILVTEVGARWLSLQTGPGAPTPYPEVGIVTDENGALVAKVEVHRIEMSHTGAFVLLVPPAQPGWYAVGLEGGPSLAY